MEWGGSHRMHLLTVPIGLIDGGGVGVDAEDEAAERLELLHNRLRAMLWADDVDRNWGCAFLHLFRSLSEWQPGEIQSGVGSNLSMFSIALILRVTMEAGIVWEKNEDGSYSKRS